MSAQIKSFGCRLNSYEGDLIAEYADDNSIVINTCTVTNEAERQVRQTVRKLKRENPDKKIIVVGCAIEINRDLYEAMPEVDLVLDNKEKLIKENYANNQTYSEKTSSSHTRAFVKIQTGCNNKCTFCIVPYTRGESVSDSPEIIIQTIQNLVKAGHNEIVITGVNIVDYYHDMNLGELCRHILQEVPELPRLRLSSIDAIEIDDTLFDLFANEPRLMPHLHISIQSGDDMILKRMARRHTRQDIIDLCSKLREVRPDFVFGADFITGFPTETEEMFQNTVNLVNEADITWLHVFPYSAKEGTPAAKMPQVPVNIRKKRASVLRELGKAKEEAYIKSKIGSKVSAIIETSTTARSDDFIPINISKSTKKGEIVQVVIQKYRDGKVFGTIL